MKSFAYAVTLLLLVFHSGCRQSTEPGTSDMYVNIDVESAFQDTAVKILLDNTLILDSRVTTNNVLSLAWSSGYQKLSRNNHTLLFSVPEYGVQKSYAIDIAHDTSTVLLRFDQASKQITIQQIKGRVLRD